MGIIDSCFVMTLHQCKDLLRSTSYSTHFNGSALWDNIDIDNAADIGKAASKVYNQKA